MLRALRWAAIVGMLLPLKASTRLWGKRATCPAQKPYMPCIYQFPAGTTAAILLTSSIPFLAHVTIFNQFLTSPAQHSLLQDMLNAIAKSRWFSFISYALEINYLRKKVG